MSNALEVPYNLNLLISQIKIMIYLHEGNIQDKHRTWQKFEKLFKGNKISSEQKKKLAHNILKHWNINKNKYSKQLGMFRSSTLDMINTASNSSSSSKFNSDSKSRPSSDFDLWSNLRFGSNCRTTFSRRSSLSSRKLSSTPVNAAHITDDIKEKMESSIQQLELRMEEMQTIYNYMLCQNQSVRKHHNLTNSFITSAQETP